MNGEEKHSRRKKKRYGDFEGNLMEKRGRRIAWMTTAIAVLALVGATVAARQRLIEQSHLYKRNLLITHCRRISYPCPNNT